MVWPGWRTEVVVGCPVLGANCNCLCIHKQSSHISIKTPNAVEIVKSLDRPKIHLSVNRVALDFETIFDWLLSMIQTLGVDGPKYWCTAEFRMPLRHCIVCVFY